MRLLLLHLVALSHCGASDITRRAIFDCSRMDTSYCCTTRVRTLCADQCEGIFCSDGGAEMSQFNIEMMTTPSPMTQPPLDSELRVQQAHDGDARTSRTLSPQLPFTEAPPRVTSSTGFPTLIPFEPNIDAVDISQAKFDVTPEPIIHSTVVKSIHHRSRTTPDPRIIKPPESLVVIGEYDYVDAENKTPIQVPAATVAPQANSAVVFTAKNDGPVMPQSFISEEAIVERGVRGQSLPKNPAKLCSQVPTHHRCRTRLAPFKRRAMIASKRTFRTPHLFIGPPRLYRRRSARPTPRWYVKLLPQQTPWPDVTEKLPAFAVDGIASKPVDIASHKGGIGSLIRNYATGLTKMHPYPENGDFIESNALQVASASRTTQSPIKIRIKPVKPHRSGKKPRPTTPKTTFHEGPESTDGDEITEATQAPRRPPSIPRPPTAIRHSQSGSVQPTAVQQEKCGVAPDFTPCVSSEEASHALLECCRRKNLPPGCLALCRYDITQAEVRSAMDRGQCGLFSVTPYLECASQGKDNSECCRHKGIASKTGPQCEQFCRPTRGLTPLGLQHIVCGNAIGDMLRCHHAGIR
ncbi:hypothetical protein Q1695_005671 [Nippostrongylus brasiliensis]|nr:hypothetical protein Q1695_005671 [Nippostrongylus brasiliensis]